MANISVSVDSSAAQAVINSAPNRIRNAMAGGMTDATTYLIARMRRYPPTRPNQKYIRTGTLGRSWFSRTEGSGLNITGRVFSAGNIAPYNRIVQDRQHQGRLFRGRWQTIQDVAEQEQNTVVRMFADRLAAAGLDRP